MKLRLKSEWFVLNKQTAAAVTSTREWPQSGSLQGSCYFPRGRRKGPHPVQEPLPPWLSSLGIRDGHLCWHCSQGLWEGMEVCVHMCPVEGMKVCVHVH